MARTLPKLLGLLSFLALAQDLPSDYGSGVRAADGCVPVQTAFSTLDREGCCKTCRKGKACGDSCIARDKQCHKPPGCACDE
jgi:hypothetical protein